jgi:hypothetical protein
MRAADPLDISGYQTKNNLTKTQSKDENLKASWKTWKEKSLDEKTKMLLLGKEKYLPYFSSDGEVNWERGRQLFISTVKNKHNVKESTLPKNVTSANIGFIPMGVDLTLDGLGGMKVYNQLKVNSLHLPVGYPDELELVIVGIDHQIQDNSWITKVRTYTKPTSQPWGVGMDSSVMNYNPKSVFAAEEITFFEKDDPNDEINRLEFGRVGAIPPMVSYLKSQRQINGKLTPDYLVDIGNGKKLAKTPAEFFHSWMEELRRKGLLGEVILTSAYRTSEEQNRLSAISTEPGRVAIPGTSNHCWGIAVDLSPFSTSTSPKDNLTKRQTDTWKRVAAIGAKYGWYNPERLSDQKGVDEAWHFEYWGGNEAKITNTQFQGIKILPN